MQKQPSYASPDDYVASLRDWQLPCVVALRGAVRGAAELEERVKWGHLVYFSNGPVLLIRSEPNRLLLGFWRGQRLLQIEPRLKPGGKYEMATLVLQPSTPLTIEGVQALTVRAVALNRELGDPTRVAHRSSKKR